MELGATTDAKEAFEKVLSQTETVTAARAELGLGELLLRDGNHADAAKRFLKVNFLYGYPEWKPIALLKAAQCFRELKQNDKARKYLELLVKDYPDTEPGKTAKDELAKL